MDNKSSTKSQRTEKAEVFLENLIADNLDWMTSWLSKKGNEAFDADMIFLRLNKYHYDNGYRFNKTTAKIALDLFYQMPGGRIAAGVVLNSYIENQRKIPVFFYELHSDLLLLNLDKFSNAISHRKKDRRDYLMTWLTHLLSQLFHLPLSPRSNRKSDIGNTAVEIVHNSLRNHFNNHGFGNITSRAITKAVDRFTKRYPFVANI